MENRCSVAKSCPTLCNYMDRSTPGSSVLRYLPEFAQIHVHWVGDAKHLISKHLILCCPLLLLSSIFPSVRVFSNDLSLHIRWPKYWNFSLSDSHSNEYSGLVSLRVDRFDLLAVQATLKSLLQHHNSKASILQHSAFFMVQLSHLCMTSGKTIVLTIHIFVDKVISLLFHMLSRFVIAFLPKSKRLLISWLQSLSAVFLEPKKINSVTVSTFSPSICHEVMGPAAMILVFWMSSFKPAFSTPSLNIKVGVCRMMPRRNLTTVICKPWVTAQSIPNQRRDGSCFSPVSPILRECLLIVDCIL